MPLSPACRIDARVERQRGREQRASRQRRSLARNRADFAPTTGPTVWPSALLCSLPIKSTVARVCGLVCWISQVP
ncbi:MAG: hypothetical protein U0Z44_19840 [Kouleothrix sp.]